MCAECAYEYREEECEGLCEISSPGYPGIYPQHSSCVYTILARPGTHTTIRIAFKTLSLQDSGKYGHIQH